MRQDKEYIISKSVEFANLVKQHIDKTKGIFLFGSFARGTQREHSDIDIAIVLDNNKEDKTKLSANLFHLVWGVDCRIEPHIMDEETDYADMIKLVKKEGILVG